MTRNSREEVENAMEYYTKQINKCLEELNAE